jgi:hypothetical protein
MIIAAKVASIFLFCKKEEKSLKAIKLLPISDAKFITYKTFDWSYPVRLPA